MGLIGDLFPALDVPRKRDLDFEKHVHEAAIDLKLQPEDNFILKVFITHYPSLDLYYDKMYKIWFLYAKQKVETFRKIFCNVFKIFIQEK